MKSALRKKYLPLLLALLCLLAFTGCQKAAPEKTAPVMETESTPEPTEEPTPEPTEESTPEPAPEPAPEPTEELAVDSTEDFTVDSEDDFALESNGDFPPDFMPELEEAPPRDPDKAPVEWFEEDEKCASYYSVTCGSNSNRGYAEYGVKNMRHQGYNPFLYTPLASPHSNCIMIGFFFTEEEARAYAEELHSVHVDGVMCEQAYAVTIHVPNSVANVYQFLDWQ